MQTIREIRLKKLCAATSENLANSENELLKLYDSFVAGEIPANKTKRIFSVLIQRFEIDFNRYARICRAIDPENDEKKDLCVNFWINHYCNIFA